MKLRTVNWYSQILRRNGLLKQCIEEKEERTGRRAEDVSSC